MRRACFFTFLPLVCAALTAHAAATAAVTTHPAAATRPGITTPLAGDALAAELDQRFGIWFVGGKLPASASASLPENATPDEALALLRKALPRDDGGFQISAVPGSDQRVFQLVAAGAKPPPCQYGADAGKIAVSEDPITQIIPLKQVDAAPLLKDLAPFLSADGSQSVNAAHNCLILTDTSSKINRIVQIIQKLDNQPPIATVTERRPLKYNNAVETARLINFMFDPRGTGHSSIDPVTPNPPGTLNAQADPPTNTVILNGPEAQLKQALEMIDRMESVAATTSAPARGR